MGVYFMLCQCVNCRTTITCNPHKVPSIKVLGVKEPLCRACVDYANDLRIKAGLEVFMIPDGAYDVVGERGLL